MLSFNHAHKCAIVLIFILVTNLNQSKQNKRFEFLWPSVAETAVEQCDQRRNGSLFLTT